MNYIENTYICIAAPLLLAILILRREGRRALCFTLVYYKFSIILFIKQHRRIKYICCFYTKIFSTKFYSTCFSYSYQIELSS